MYLSNSDSINLRYEECVCTCRIVTVSTSGMNNITYPCRVMGYQQIHKTSQRTGLTKRKHIRQSAYQLITLTGDCLSQNAEKLCTQVLNI